MAIHFFFCYKSKKLPWKLKWKFVLLFLQKKNCCRFVYIFSDGCLMEMIAVLENIWEKNKLCDMFLLLSFEMIFLFASLVPVTIQYCDLHYVFFVCVGIRSFLCAFIWSSFRCYPRNTLDFEQAQDLQAFQTWRPRKQKKMNNSVQ